MIPSVNGITTYSSIGSHRLDASHALNSNARMQNGIIDAFVPPHFNDLQVGSINKQLASHSNLADARHKRVSLLLLLLLLLL